MDTNRPGYERVEEDKGCAQLRDDWCTCENVQLTMMLTWRSAEPCLGLDGSEGKYPRKGEGGW